MREIQARTTVPRPDSERPADKDDALTQPKHAQAPPAENWAGTEPFPIEPRADVLDQGRQFPVAPLHDHTDLPRTGVLGASVGAAEYGLALTGSVAFLALAGYVATRGRGESVAPSTPAPAARVAGDIVASRVIVVDSLGRPQVD